MEREGNERRVHTFACVGERGMDPVLDSSLVHEKGVHVIKYVRYVCAGIVRVLQTWACVCRVGVEFACCVCSQSCDEQTLTGMQFSGMEA